MFKDAILDDESPLAGAKKSKDTSMWKAIESLKDKKRYQEKKEIAEQINK